MVSERAVTLQKSPGILTGAFCSWSRSPFVRNSPGHFIARCHHLHTKFDQSILDIISLGHFENPGLRMNFVVIKLLTVVGKGSQPRNYPPTVTISLLSVTLELSKTLNRSDESRTMSSE